MKILHLSDTHGYHRSITGLPQADVIVHSGDFTMAGDEKEALDFIEWFCDLDYPQKIFISGNHDECMYGSQVEGLDENVHYLCNSGIEIAGVKFYGVPMFMGDCITNRQSRFYSQIPSDTDVLITHSPAFGILDLDDSADEKYINYGSEELLARLPSLNVGLHLFGHVHRQHGILEKDGIIFSNGAIMNEDYSRINLPNVIEF